MAVDLDPSVPKVLDRKGSAPLSLSPKRVGSPVLRTCPRVLGSSFHLGTTELSSCAIVATSHWIPSAPHQCWNFSARVSVDQDLTVVAEAMDDDVVKQRLVPIVFSRA